MKSIQKILLVTMFAVLLVCVWMFLIPQISRADGPLFIQQDIYNNDVSLDSIISELTLDTVFTVNSIGDAADSNPGNGDCDDGAGNCTLRAAIEESNALSGMDTIAFEIEGEGPHTIQPTSALPVITDPVIIDGTTEPDYVDSPIVELFGNDMIDGLVVEAGNSTIRGLVINRFDEGIVLKTNGSNFVEGNYIGTDISGTTEYPNYTGILVHNGSNNNTIGGTSVAKRNIISDQIRIEKSDNNKIQGNYIGTDVTGTEIFTTGGGIAIAEGSNNIIGGAVANAGNLISGNGTGIYIGGEENITVQGNLIGTDKTGTIALGNGFGIDVEANSTGTIGGTDAGARNIISGNATGVRSKVSNIQIQGNYIGTDINGKTALGNNYGIGTDSALIGGTEPGAGNLISGNDSDGVVLRWDTIFQGNIVGLNASGTDVISNGGSGLWVNYDNNLIGGPEPGAGNVISGNQLHGIDIGWMGDGNIIQGNLIGTDITGEVIIGNSQLGISIGTNNNLVGGSTIEHGNTIKGNGMGGITIGGINNGIRANSIYDNGFGYSYCDNLGIDLGCGVTINDPGDVDEGDNHLQNFPVLIPSIEPNILFSGTLNSTSNTVFTLDFFSNSSCDPSKYGEGEHYLGSIDVTTDGAGNADFQIGALDVYPKGAFITATATDPENNTSEFSKCIILKSVYLPMIAKP